MLRRNLISLSATVVFISFFLPWIHFFGSNLSGLDIQKNFTSYRLVWLMPLLAAGTLGLNMAGQKTDLFRRLAGLCPFGILVYALNGLGGDLFSSLAPGGWLALIGGAALVCIPNAPKAPTPA
jgi:hypothetical protein